MTNKELIQLIREAFQGVTLGDGIGLWEAQAIDDYAEADRPRLREQDEKLDWSKIDFETLIRCDSSLSFFDADGMRFHLPAFLIMEVSGVSSNGLYYHLTRLDDFMLEKYSSLSSQQRHAVSQFLYWYIDQGFAMWEDDVVLWALEFFWEKNSPR